MNNILDYVYTNKFIDIYVNNKVFPIASKHSAQVSIHRGDFDPDVMNIPDDNDLGIPNAISCANPVLSDSGVFVCDNMNISWNDNIFSHRDDKPASINLGNVHYDGTIMDHISRWSINWIRHGIPFRQSGPNIITSPRNPRSNVTIDNISWYHPSDNSLITKNDIRRILAKHDIELDLMKAYGSVFSNIVDEMAFFSDI